ncbi:hypothetical protein Tco_0293860, partial [Tanacetum coccineum]
MEKDIGEAYVDTGKSSGVVTAEEDKPSRRELELKKKLHELTGKLQTIEMASEKFKDEVAYFRKQYDAAHEKASNVRKDKQERSNASNDVQSMAFDEDAKVYIDEKPKPSTTLHYFITADDVQSMAL